MSTSKHSRTPTFSSSRTFDRDGFEPLNRGDATVDIPLDSMSSQTAYRPPTAMDEAPSNHNEKTGLWHRKGLRHKPKPKPITARTGWDGEEDKVTRMGHIYKRILNSSVVVRYVFFVLPLGILLAVPVVIGATAAQDATIGDSSGPVRIVWLFVWLECCWVGLWVSKIVAHFLPYIFEAICGVVSSGTRKYALVLKALQIPLSLCGWALVSLATFMPIMTRNPEWRAQKKPSFEVQDWMHVMNRILASFMISSLIFLAERFLIQIITVNYHRKQFAAKIRENKHSIHLLTLLYDASRTLFPAFCDEFQDEDAIIGDTIEAAIGKHKKRHNRSGSSTPMRVLRDVGRLGDKVHEAFSNVAAEVTGKAASNPHSAHGIVSEALEKNRSSEALARRLWLSFVIEGNDALYQDDIYEVLGNGRDVEAEECFGLLDKDANGDVSLDEMILTVTQIGRDRNSIHDSSHDIDQAVKVLDRMLCTVVFIVVCFIFIAFLNTTFVTTLATAGTALISLSFVFSVTAQEILGSCIFLFVKHPYDIGDRVDLNNGDTQLVVEHISLLFTVFRRIDNNRTVQIPNILMNTLWVENVSRSKAMKEQLSLFVSFDTSLQDIQLLRQEMFKFVSDKENSRDFQQNFEVEVAGINEMDKLELRVEISHKSNWANETVRAARRSKFMCALVLALRKVPIYGPAGGDPVLGAAGNPTYSVTLSPPEGQKQRDESAKDKEGKRMVPLSKEKSPTSPAASPKSALGPQNELTVVNSLNNRAPSMDEARDAGTDRAATSPLMRSPRASESNDADDNASILRRETTKGRRKATRTEDSDTVGIETVPQIGITAPTPAPRAQWAPRYTPPSTSYNPAAGTAPPIRPEHYWDTGIVEDSQRDSPVLPQDDPAMPQYGAFPPPPAPTIRPRDASLPSNFPRPLQSQSSSRGPAPPQQQYPPPSQR